MVSNRSKKFTVRGEGFVRKRTSRTRGNIVIVPASEVTFHISSTRQKRGSTKTVIIADTVPGAPQTSLSCTPGEASPDFPILSTEAPQSSTELPETVSFNVADTTTQERSDYEYRKSREVDAWENLRTAMLQTAIEQQAIYTEKCAYCPVRGIEDPKTAEYRCQDCIPVLLCRDCIVLQHATTCLHVIEMWTPELGTFIETVLSELRILTVPGKLPDQISSERCMTLIDEKGRTHYECTVVYVESSPDSLISSLLRLGFWPVSPSNPNVAVSVRLLSLLHCLTLECHTSCTGFTAAVDKSNISHGVHFKSKLRSIGRGECLPEFRLFIDILTTAPLSLQQDMKPLIDACPACPKRSEEGGIIVAMDANFGLVHKQNSGKTYNSSSPLDGTFFLPQDTVDNFVHGYYQDQKDNNEQCSQFQAADAMRVKNRTPNLTVTGVFGCSCRHEIPLVFMDIRHGERLAYSVLCLQHLKQREMHIQAMYDIACVLQNHLKKRDNSDLLDNVQLAIGAFHLYGHKGLCQVTMSPRRLAGYGLTDGEQMERLWSYLRPFSKITKEQTPGHRKEQLILALRNFADRKREMLEVNLLQKLTKARDSKSTAGKNLQVELATILAPHDGNAFIQQLKDEEKIQFNTISTRSSSSSSRDWRRAYAKELLRFYTLRSQLNSGIIFADDNEKVLQATRDIQLSSKKLEIFEKRHKIQRWVETSMEYQVELRCIDDLRRKALLLKLQGLAAEKQFNIDFQKKYPEGQTISNRLNNQLKKIRNRISTTTKAYNIGAHSTQESTYPSSIRNDEVYVGSELFTSLEQEGYTSQIPSQVRRKLIDLSNLIERCEEEEKMVLSEMRNSYVHFGQMHATLLEMIESVPRNTLFEAGLYSLGMQFLGRLQIKLRRMYNLFLPEIEIPTPPEWPPRLIVDVGSGDRTLHEMESSEDEDEENQDNEEDKEDIENYDEEEECDLFTSENVEIIYY